MPPVSGEGGMPPRALIRSSLVRHSLAALALALAVPLLASTPARGEIIPAAQMARGIPTSQTQCAAQPQTVWVTVAARSFCIRYYLSNAGGQGTTPVVWLSGDKLGRYDGKTRQFETRPDERDVDTALLERMAENLSKQAGTTAIYLARLGLDGSSGFHGQRRSWLELYVLNAALDAIRRRHGFDGFHLAGQSGGAGLVGGLVALREDIGCAVPGAGRLALIKPARRQSDPMLEQFDAAETVETIATRRRTRLIVITDPDDRQVAARHQNAFVAALRRAGGRVEQFFVQAADEKRHGVAVYTRFAVAACVRGKGREEIAEGLARLEERHLAAARTRRARQQAGAASPPPSAPGRSAAGEPARPGRGG